MADNFFSLELGEDSIRVADAKLINHQIEIDSLGYQENTSLFFNMESEKEVEEQARIIERLVKGLKIRKKNVNVIIPDSYSYCQILSMPFLKEKELLSAIKYQADQFIPLPLEETAIDLDIVFEDKNKKKLLVLIVAASQNLIEKIEKLVEMAGLIPEFLESESSSLCRFVSNFYKGEGNNGKIFVNFGYHTTTIYFFNPQVSLITNLHNFKLGMDLFLKEVEVNFNLSEDKAKEALKTIGLSQGGSLNLGEVLKPTITFLQNEIEKFVIAIKDKEKEMVISEIILFNLANEIFHLEKEIEKSLGIATVQLNLGNFIKKNPLSGSFSNKLSSFVTVISGALR